MVLAGVLAWWLFHEPPEHESPQVLMGLPQRSASVATAADSAADGPDGGESTTVSNGVSGLAASLPAAFVAQQAQTSAPPTEFKPNPSLIVPPTPSHAWPARPVQTILEAQIALARQALSSGSIDGLNGPKTRRALRAFQAAQGLPVTGALDAATRARLLLIEPPYTRHIVTAEDLDRLLPVPPTWIGKSGMQRLDYETLVELVAEQSQSSPDLIRQLNQNLDWGQVAEGTSLVVPNVRTPPVRDQAARIRISFGERTLEVFDAGDQLVALFPCSIARAVEDRLVGRLHVASIVPNPDYLFDPARFRQTPEVRQIKERLTIPPGPNNPVGVMWLGLDRPGYGIHGTPTPELVGQAESLGCFRLTNWDAQLLARLAWVGMPVDVVP
jgi:lipoprotein-anchoring transpeptidase ErfK/SrfK